MNIKLNRAYDIGATKKKITEKRWREKAVQKYVISAEVCYKNSATLEEMVVNEADRWDDELNEIKREKK